MSQEQQWQHKADVPPPWGGLVSCAIFPHWQLIGRRGTRGAPDSKTDSLKERDSLQTAQRQGQLPEPSIFPDTH